MEHQLWFDWSKPMAAGAEGSCCGLQQLHVLKVCGEQEPIQCIHTLYDIKWKGIGRMGSFSLPGQGSICIDLARFGVIFSDYWHTSW